MIPPIAGRFVAGETPAAAFEHVRRTNEDGVNVILNLLGEHYHDRAEAETDADAYVSLIRDIGDTDLDACVSVKPSQLGIDIGDDVFRENFRRVVAAGDEHGVFVWCDMEDADTTDATLDAFEALAREFDGGVGLCVQANLRRTRGDLDRLVDVPGRIRLVKGAYDEPESIAYTDKADVNEAYREDLEFLFKERDDGIAVGSHDPAMISLAEELHAEHGADYEVQMLMGVRDDEQRRLAADGVEVWQYAPYGDRWLSYFYRRVRERKENALFAVRAVLGV
ncbi:proline dehydrogenase family protein [Halobaculum sp. CBA1158]|uniref:proline dehydrogenase family protein n=1 Tax=Halobaculum sp. CBA1158 TaxID=2904243 RepID=UPI001F23BA8F|nr:proline dehydrogenase family protein [Halobaculum sp. CBA1158]UIP00730.1 proline dehydrogenase family protein [Halobaculum sp. CBA1158]